MYIVMRISYDDTAIKQSTSKRVLIMVRARTAHGSASYMRVSYRWCLHWSNTEVKSSPNNVPGTVVAARVVPCEGCCNGRF